MNIFVVIFISIFLYTSDLLSRYIYVQFNPTTTTVPHNARWFFIHALSNGAIAALGTRDVLHCLGNISTCELQPLDDQSMYALIIALLFHIYHVLFFWRHLTSSEWLHHGLMVGISGPLSMYCQSRATIVALCFLTGYPGMIDYAMLWCVKMGWISKQLERSCNARLNLWVRSPGCMFSAFLTLPEIMTGNMISIIMATLCFWNGQYYMSLAMRADMKIN